MPQGALSLNCMSLDFKQGLVCLVGHTDGLRPVLGTMSEPAHLAGQGNPKKELL